MWPAKLVTLAEDWGMSVMELLEEYAIDSVAPGICMNHDCDYSTEYEPDQHEGRCEACGTNTVKSAFVLAGMI